MKMNLEDINYWLSLCSQGEYDILENELRETQLSLLPTWEEENIPDIDTDDAFDIAEGYSHDG